MATYNKFNAFTNDLLNAVHDFNGGTHVFKAVFTNTAPVATNSVLADLTQISTGGGYTQASGGSGGITLDTVAVSQVSGSTYKVTVADEVFTATGAVGPFRYVAIFNETATGDPLVCWYDYGSSVTLADTETFTINFDDTNGLFQLG